MDVVDVDLTCFKGLLSMDKFFFKGEGHELFSLSLIQFLCDFLPPNPPTPRPKLFFYFSAFQIPDEHIIVHFALFLQIKS